MELHLRSRCRLEGHTLQWLGAGDAQALITAGSTGAERWSGAERPGFPDLSTAHAIAQHPPQRWGLAAPWDCGKSGSPSSRSPADKMEVWPNDAGRIYAQKVLPSRRFCYLFWGRTPSVAALAPGAARSLDAVTATQVIEFAMRRRKCGLPKIGGP